MQVKLKERIILGAMLAGPLLAVVGFLLAFVGVAPVKGLVLAAVGLGVQTVLSRVLAGVDYFHTFGVETSGGRDYDSTIYQGRLRTAALVLNALTVFAAIVLVVAFWLRLGGQTVTTADVISRSMFVLNVALAAAWLAAAQTSMRTPREPKRTWLIDTFMQVSLLFALAFLVAAVMATYRDLTIFGRAFATRADVPMILMAAQASVAVGLYLSRRLPSFYSVLRRDPGLTSVEAQRTRTVLLPTIAAFSLMFILVLVILAYGIGFADVISEVADNPVVIGLLVVLAVMVAAAAVVAVRIGASQDQKPPRIRVLVDEETRKENLLVLVSGLAAFFAVGLGITMRQGIIPGVPDHLWFDTIGVGALVAIGPYGFYAASRHKRIREMEDRFPDFLRDLASSHKGGLTLYASVSVAARGDYGALSPEVHKMADQLSWHVPFEEALARFAQRVHTPLVERSVNLILEASRSGGSTTEVLLAAARDARELKNLENDRRLNMSVYTIVIYVTFMVFLLVAAILYSRFVPSLLASSAAAGDLGGDVGGISFKNSLTLDDYRIFYFTAAIVQGVGDGIIAGLMGSGRAVLGLRHSFWMVLIAWVTFVFFI